MKTVLFLCTGNTCRSPMAACMFNHLAADSGNLSAISAGINTRNGLPASDGAKHAMQKRGLSLENHRSSLITPDLLSKADIIFAVSQRHLDYLTMQFPSIKAELRCFQPEITDPFGGSDAHYELAAAEMETQIAAFYSELCAK